MRTSKAVVTAFWLVTLLFCLEMTFTAWWEWVSPLAGEAFVRLGFPAVSFRLELSAAKVLGVLALLVPPTPVRVREWAYAGFAFNLVSALIAHCSIHDRPAAFAPSTISLLLGACSYVLWRRRESLWPARLQAVQAEAETVVAQATFGASRVRERGL